MTTPCSAWLLVPYGLPPFAVAEHQMVEYVSAVTPHEVPMTPAHCTAVIEWRQRLVPFMELGGLVGPRSTGVGQQAAVLAYQTEPGTPLHYVAVAVQVPPTRLSVTDDMACALPDSHQELWDWLAISCFSREGVATPILSVTQLCSEAFRCYVESLPAVAPAEPEHSTSPALVGVAQETEVRDRLTGGNRLPHTLLHDRHKAANNSLDLDADEDEMDEELENDLDTRDAVDDDTELDDDEDEEFDDDELDDEDDDEMDEDEDELDDEDEDELDDEDEDELDDEDEDDAQDEEDDEDEFEEVAPRRLPRTLRSTK